MPKQPWGNCWRMLEDMAADNARPEVLRTQVEQLLAKLQAHFPTVG